MTIHVWRIVKARHRAHAFSGEGSRRYGGRWSSPGRPAVYCSSSTSLAMLELLVHIQSPDLAKGYLLLEATFSDSLLTTVEQSSLPSLWRQTPAPRELRRIGDEWLDTGKTAVLRVPSAIVPAEWNYLLNPAHPGFAKIRLGPARPLRFDRRLK